MKKAFYIAILAFVFTSCRDTAAEKVALDQQQELDSIKAVMKAEKEALAKQKTVDSMNAIIAEKDAAAAQRVAAASARNTAPVTAEQKKKGWSSTAKGAVIGAELELLQELPFLRKKAKALSLVAWQVRLLELEPEQLLTVKRKNK